MHNKSIISSLHFQMNFNEFTLNIVIKWNCSMQPLLQVKFMFDSTLYLEENFETKQVD